MAAGLTVVNEKNFQAEVAGSAAPVLVDFGATWCGPCRALAPIVEDIAKEYAGRLKVATVDIDQAPGLAQQFNIMSVPTIILFKGGQAKDKVIGLLQKPKLKERIDKLLV